MIVKIIDLIDFDKVNTLLEGFNKSTGFVTAILDLEGNILSKSGWRQICTEFHRIHPETSKKCTISDTILANKMAEGEKYHFYQCLNGLIDVAVPIVIKGEHIANLFSGQFFFDKPDFLFFTEQARKYGFNEISYTKALEKVPIVSKEKVKIAMDFLQNMTQLVCETSLQKLEQTELNKALKESEERFQLLFKKAPLGYQALDFDGNFIDVNQQWLDTLGYEREEVIGKWFGDFLTPAFKDGFRKRFPIFKAQGQIHSEFEMAHKNGMVLFIAFDGSVGYDSKGEFKQTHCILQNITERKLAEEKLIRSENELKKAQQITHIGSWYLDIATNEVVWTEELYKMYGFDPALPPPAYTEHQKLFTPESWELLSNSLSYTAKTGIPYELELKTLKDDGSNGWMWVRGETVTDNEGKTIALWGAAQDITKRKMMEEALRKSEENLSITLNSIGDGVISTNLNGLIVQMNPVAEMLCGWKLTDALGKTLPEVFKILNADTRQIVADPVKEVLEHGEFVGLANHTLLISKNGTEYQIADSAAPIKNAEGEITGVVLVFSDITEKYTAELALKESEERFKALHDASFGGIAIHDKGKILECNKGLSKITGYSYDELIGMDALLLIAPNTRDLVLSNILSGYEKPYEALGLRKNGELFPLRLEARNIPYKGRDVRTVEFRDITEIKQAEMIKQVQYKIANAVIASKNLNELFHSISNELNSIIDAKNLFIALYNEETKMLSSPVFKDEKDDFIEWPAKKSLTGYVINQKHPVLLRKNEIIRLYEEGIIELFGTISQAWLGIPLKLKGKILGAIVVQNYDKPDVYDQTSIEILELVAHELSIYIDWQRSEEKTAKLTKAIEQSSVTVLITNKKGDIEYVNPFFTKLTGYSYKEVIGKNSKILSSGHQPIEFYQTLWSSILSGNDWSGEILNKKKNGDLYWEKAAISPIFNGEGVITNFVAIKEDITERKKMVEELVKAKQKAEESDRLKSAFLANMSHEIRTPLNSIIGFSDLLNDPDFDEAEKSKFSKAIVNSGNNLLFIINDILDLSMIEYGQLKIRKEQFSVKKLLLNLESEFKAKAIDKGVDLHVKIPLRNNDIVIENDVNRTRQVFTNLITNALKFTNKGFVEIGFITRDNCIQFFVKDTGIGIASDNFLAIFDRFRQVEINQTRNYGGNGLGLAISKNLVEIMGGRIWVESELGKGSIFNFTLPYNSTIEKDCSNSFNN